MRLISFQNYLPLPTQPRLTTLNRKRKEYSQLVEQYFGRGLASLDQQVRQALLAARCTDTAQIWHQIEIDVPRTRPGIPLWSCITAQRVSLSDQQPSSGPDSEQSLERILYVWAIRHPASGYVQGINDLVCPFFQVFLNAYIGEGYQELRDLCAESRFQNPILSSSTWSTYRQLPWQPLRQTHFGACRNCWMVYRTITFLNSQGFSAWSNGWESWSSG